VRRHDVLDVERLEVVDTLEPDVLLGHRQLELLPKDLRVEQILDADAYARGLVRVGRADPAAGRADLQAAETALTRTVERDVPRHHEVSVARDEEQAERFVPP